MSLTSYFQFLSTSHFHLNFELSKVNFSCEISHFQNVTSHILYYSNFQTRNFLRIAFFQLSKSTFQPTTIIFNNFFKKSHSYFSPLNLYKYIITFEFSQHPNSNFCTPNFNIYNFKFTSVIFCKCESIITQVVLVSYFIL